MRQNLFQRAKSTVKAVDDVTFEIAPGETLGLVGESGCGKSTLGRAVIRLIEPTSGEIIFDGVNIGGLEGKALRDARRHFQMIFQDPVGSLNPRMTAGDAIAEGLLIHRLARNDADKRARVEALLAAVGLEPARASRYPHEFSGGQRQRIGIARALALQPKLIVCDEPVSALDVSVQAQIVNLLARLQAEHRIAYLFIAHDLAVVEHISRRIMVVYLGKIMELGPAREITTNPRHPYTQALVAAAPSWGSKAPGKKFTMEGEAPSPIDPPAGCPFHTRCPRAFERCRVESPGRTIVGERHWAACHAVEEEVNMSKAQNAK